MVRGNQHYNSLTVDILLLWSGLHPGFWVRGANIGQMKNVGEAKPPLHITYAHTKGA